jgi:hypothetical protein
MVKSRHSLNLFLKKFLYKIHYYYSMINIKLKEENYEYEIEITNLYTLHDKKCNTCKEGASEFLISFYFNKYYLSYKQSYHCINCFYQKLSNIKNDIINLNLEKVLMLKILCADPINIYLNVKKLNNAKQCCLKCNNNALFIIIYTNNSNPEEITLCQNCLSNLLLNILNQI